MTIATKPKTQIQLDLATCTAFDINAAIALLIDHNVPPLGSKDDNQWNEWLDHIHYLDHEDIMIGFCQDGGPFNINCKDDGTYHVYLAINTKRIRSGYATHAKLTWAIGIALLDSVGMNIKRDYK